MQDAAEQLKVSFLHIVCAVSVLPQNAESQEAIGEGYSAGAMLPWFAGAGFEARTAAIMLPGEVAEFIGLLGSSRGLQGEASPAKRPRWRVD